MLNIDTQVEVLIRLGRALSHPTRARILMALLDRPAYPAVIADELGLTRANVSNHLACLRGCGLVVAEPEGRRTRYEVADPHLTQALGSLVEVVLAVDEGAACADAHCALECCVAQPRRPGQPGRPVGVVR